MPEHNPFQPIVPATPDLRPDSPLGEPPNHAWSANPMVPHGYDGPTPDREFDAGFPAGRGRAHSAAPVPAVPPPTEPRVEPSTSPAPRTDL